MEARRRVRFSYNSLGTKMAENRTYPPEFEQAFRERFGTDVNLEDTVPPVFKDMMGELLDYDPVTRTLKGRFPVMTRYQNPYEVMQGGMIAAAMDNVLGPLSVLVAPANLTREITVKYKKPVSEEFAFIVVKAWVEKLELPYLWLAARAESEDGLLFARAEARHFILEQEE